VGSSAGTRVSEDVVAAILEAADLPVARGRLADRAKQRRGRRDGRFPVAIKGSRRRSRIAPPPASSR
jgi:hypothetical protein